jgi:hypothetical protein
MSQDLPKNLHKKVVDIATSYSSDDQLVLGTSILLGLVIFAGGIPKKTYPGVGVKVNPFDDEVTHKNLLRTLGCFADSAL